MATFNVWNRILTADEICTLYKSDKAVQYSDMTSGLQSGNICSLPLNDGVASGQEYIDQSGNGNNGTPVGSPPITTPTLDFTVASSCSSVSSSSQSSCRNQ